MAIASLGPITALNGLLLIGWSIAVIFEVMRMAELRRLCQTCDRRDVRSWPKADIAFAMLNVTLVSNGGLCRYDGSAVGLRVNTHEQWQLSMKAAELYERYPARYILGPWAPLLVETARLTRGERVLDVACGTGVVARAAAKQVGPSGRVVGIDLNPGMIAVARSLPAMDGDAPTEWLERSALDLGLERASFDVVLCQQGLQFFPDKAVALREMRRVLVHGGRLALSVWNNVGLYNTAVSAALAQFVGGEVAARFNASRKAPAADELRRLIAEADFLDGEVSVSRINVHLPRIDKFVLDHLAATPVAPAVTSADAEARKKIGASVMQQLQSYADGDGITYPEETYVLTARVR